VDTRAGPQSGELCSNNGVHAPGRKRNPAQLLRHKPGSISSQGHSNIQIKHTTVMMIAYQGSLVGSKATSSTALPTTHQGCTLRSTILLCTGCQPEQKVIHIQ
jgi:hypothetical protein